MADWAQKQLQVTGTPTGDGAHRANTTGELLDRQQVNQTKGILKHSDSLHASSEKETIKGILKHSYTVPPLHSPPELKSILKPETASSVSKTPKVSPDRPHSILKKVDSLGQIENSETKGILKKDASLEEETKMDKKGGILRRKDSASNSVENTGKREGILRRSSESDKGIVKPDGILKSSRSNSRDDTSVELAHVPASSDGSASEYASAAEEVSSSHDPVVQIDPHEFLRSLENLDYKSPSVAVSSHTEKLTVTLSPQGNSAKTDLFAVGSSQGREKQSNGLMNSSEVISSPNQTIAAQNKSTLNDLQPSLNSSKKDGLNSSKKDGLEAGVSALQASEYNTKAEQNRAAGDMEESVKSRVMGSASQQRASRKSNATSPSGSGSVHKKLSPRPAGSSFSEVNVSSHNNHGGVLSTALNHDEEEVYEVETDLDIAYSMSSTGGMSEGSVALETQSDCIIPTISQGWPKGNAIRITSAGELQSQPSEHEVQPSDLQARPSDVQTRLSDIQTRHSDLSVQPSSLETRPSDLQTQPSSLETRPSGVQKRLSDLQARSSDLQTRPSDLQTQPSDLQTRPSDLQAQSSDLQTWPSDLQAQNSDLQSGSSDLQAGSSDLQAGSSDLQAGSSDLQAGSSDLQAGSSDLQTGSSDLQRQLSDHKEQLSDLETELSSTRRLNIRQAHMMSNASSEDSCVGMVSQGDVSRQAVVTSQARSGEHMDQTTLTTVMTIQSDEQIRVPVTTKEESKQQVTADKIESKQKVIKNKAIARRKLAQEMRMQNERYHTQPVENTNVVEEDVAEKSSVVAEPKLYAAHGRHHTQPITPVEKVAAMGFDSNDANTPKTKAVGGSIAERLSNLQRSGEEAWKKRVSKLEYDSSSSASESGSASGSVRMRSKTAAMDPGRPMSIADRLTLIDNATEGWKNRIEQKDVRKFTVEGKLNHLSSGVAESPILARKAALSRDVEEEASTPANKRFTVPLNAFRLPTPATTSTTRTDNEAQSTPNIPSSLSKVVVESVETSSESDAPQQGQQGRPAKVEVPTLVDDSFKAFFSSERPRSDFVKVDVNVDDFDHLFMESEDILSSTKKAQPPVRRKKGAKNPVKQLASRRDILSEYTEQRSGVAEVEMRRIKREQIVGSTVLAQEALAGLAARENFNKVQLRKADSFSEGSTPGGVKFQPHREKMLLHIKGRRQCQTRLVAPHSSSINSGDCFLLVTPTQCFLWIGPYCNVIERSKAQEIGASIAQKHELGYRGLFPEPMIVQGTQKDTPASRDFWEALGGNPACQAPGPPEEDETYESCVQETNMVYQVKGEVLTPVKDYWGAPLKHQLLNPKSAFVLDFGSEVYMWTGKQVPFATRKVALKLAEEIFKKGYDYSNCVLNPLSPLATEDQGGLPLQASERPTWALLGKVNDQMETILFKEKFIDWPDSSRMIKLKGDEKEQEKAFTPVELRPCAPAILLEQKPSEVDLVLEGCHVGRGQEWLDNSDGLSRRYMVRTLGRDVWHVLEFTHSRLDQASYGQFHSGDTYVIRWQYMVSQAGIKSLKGDDSRLSSTGREKCAYFFWQGRESTINEKGASALMTVELDEERGPQVRVVQGKEPPCFLQLFGSRMIVYLGKREEEEEEGRPGTARQPYRLFMARNELPSEAYLQEVEPKAASLRSRGCFLLLHTGTGMLTVWNGCKASADTRARTKELAENIKTSPPLELLLKKRAVITLTEVDEGQEKSEFMAGLGVSRKDRKEYDSLLTASKSWTAFTPRVFHLTSVSGSFEAMDTPNPARSHDVISPFPVLQSDLFSKPQPALLLVDAASVLYVWQGYWPEGGDEGEVTPGSAQARLNSERMCALKTALEYAKARPGRPPPVYLVHAALEPLEFTNIFPEWTTDSAVQQQQIKEGKKLGELIPVADYLEHLSSLRYGYSVLQERPLPPEVDPLHLESYLVDEEFKDVLGMSREEFAALPAWKQLNTKREKSLY